MGRARRLQLGHVATVELDVARRRQRPLDVLHEADRDELVVPSPDEQGAAGEVLEPRPDLDRPINPYAVSLLPERWEEDGLFAGPGLTAEEARKADR